MYALNFAIVLTLFVYMCNAVTDEEMFEQGKKVRAYCLAKTGVAEEMVIRSIKVMDDDPAMKCYLLCSMEQSGMFANGVVIEEGAPNVLPSAVKDRIMPIIKSCKTIKGDDDCDTAYRTQLCYQELGQEVYYII